jgi:hypothetical protein
VQYLARKGAWEGATEYGKFMEESACPWLEKRQGDKNAFNEMHCMRQ